MYKLKQNVHKTMFTFIPQAFNFCFTFHYGKNAKKFAKILLRT